MQENISQCCWLKHQHMKQTSHMKLMPIHKANNNNYKMKIIKLQNDASQLKVNCGKFQSVKKITEHIYNIFYKDRYIDRQALLLKFHRNLKSHKMFCPVLLSWLYSLVKRSKIQLFYWPATKHKVDTVHQTFLKYCKFEQREKCV